MTAPLPPMSPAPRPSHHLLAESWLAAASSQSAIAGELEAIYARAAAAIAERGPACWASGRCCNFERAGHRLYVTGLEAAYCLIRVVSTDWGAAAEEVRSGITIEGRPPVDPAYAPMPTGRGFIADLDAAIARGGEGGCPFQVRNLCGVHAIKPLGCRVYFCDRSAEQWQQDLSERLLSEIRSLHDRHGVEYRYGEWRAMLGMFRA